MLTSFQLLQTMRFKLIFLIPLICAFSTAFASPVPQGKTLLGKYQSWRTASTSGLQHTKCHVTARPEKATFVDEKHKNKKRGRTYVLVSRKANCDEPAMVTFGFGYPVDEKKEVTAAIGRRTFDLLAQGERAWAVSDQDEIRLIEAMKGGKSLVLKATSKRGACTEDTYSLTGFTKAWERANVACPKKKAKPQTSPKMKA